MKLPAICLLVLGTTGFAQGADPIFSGPQIGEKTTPFRVRELWGPAVGTERDPIAENGGKATVLVFINGLERSLLPLLRAVDQYGKERAELISSEVIFLFDDLVEGEQRVKAASGSMRLHSRIGLSLDGAEGPGNYGLNKECMMTIVAAKENTVGANFALVQPGIADAPKVIEALARTCGDTTPPSIEKLTERPMAGERAARRMNQADRFPGAVPEDPKLNGLLRQVIRPTNDQETVGKLMVEMEAYVKGNKGLTKQAIDGWTRVLHFGERYGTAHARELGRAFLAKAGHAPPVNREEND